MTTTAEHSFLQVTPYHRKDGNLSLRRLPHAQDPLHLSGENPQAVVDTFPQIFSLIIDRYEAETTAYQQLVAKPTSSDQERELALRAVLVNALSAAQTVSYLTAKYSDEFASPTPPLGQLPDSKHPDSPSVTLTRRARSYAAGTIRHLAQLCEQPNFQTDISSLLTQETGIGLILDLHNATEGTPNAVAEPYIQSLLRTAIMSPQGAEVLSQLQRFAQSHPDAMTPKAKQLIGGAFQELYFGYQDQLLAGTPQIQRLAAAQKILQAGLVAHLATDQAQFAQQVFHLFGYFPTDKFPFEFKEARGHLFKDLGILLSDPDTLKQVLSLDFAEDVLPAQHQSPTKWMLARALHESGHTDKVLQALLRLAKNYEIPAVAMDTVRHEVGWLGVQVTIHNAIINSHSPTTMRTNLKCMDLVHRCALAMGDQPDAISPAKYLLKILALIPAPNRTQRRQLRRLIKYYAQNDPDGTARDLTINWSEGTKNIFVDNMAHTQIEDLDTNTRKVTFFVDALHLATTHLAQDYIQAGRQHLVDKSADSLYDYQVLRTSGRYLYENYLLLYHLVSEQMGNATPDGIALLQQIQSRLEQSIKLLSQNCPDFVPVTKELQAATDKSSGCKPLLAASRSGLTPDTGEHRRISRLL